MAHKLPNAARQSYHFGPKCILERPKLAALLGAIAAQGAALEFEWAQLYGLLLGTRLGNPKWKKTPYGSTMTLPTDDLALQLFEYIQPFELRKKLTEKIASAQLNKHSETIRRLRDKLIPLMRDAMGKRNDYIHGLWGVCSKYSQSLIWISKDEDWSNVLVYYELDFNQTLDAIVSASTAIAAFQHQVIELFMPKH